MKFPSHASRLTGTQSEILRALRRYSALDAESIARRLWPASRQIDKKAETVRKALRSMERMGLVRNVGVAWVCAQENSTGLAEARR